MDASCRAVLEPMPGASMSVLKALDFVWRCHERLAQERDAVLRQDGEWLGRAGGEARHAGRPRTRSRAPMPSLRRTAPAPGRESSRCRRMRWNGD